MSLRKVVTAVLTIAITITLTGILPNSYAFINSDPDPRNAPTAVRGDNIYVAWSSNKTGNEEIMFRASNDSGRTFSDKINLSNTSNYDSERIEIAADGRNVIVTWWETNQTDEVPVAKVSTDFGRTFGPLLELSVNGTIGTGEAKPLL